jgi:hypothetical protein
MQSRTRGTSVQALFNRRKELRKAVNALMAEGVPTNTIHVYLVDEAGNRTREVPVESGSGALKGAFIGAATGALVGLGIAILVPLGLFGPASLDQLGMDPLFGALSAVAIGAASGVPLGALIGMGHWQGAYRIPDADFSRYRASVVVDSDAKADIAREILGDSVHSVRR